MSVDYTEERDRLAPYLVAWAANDSYSRGSRQVARDILAFIDLLLARLEEAE